MGDCALIDVASARSETIKRHQRIRIYGVCVGEGVGVIDGVGVGVERRDEGVGVGVAVGVGVENVSSSSDNIDSIVVAEFEDVVPIDDVVDAEVEAVAVGVGVGAGVAVGVGVGWLGCKLFR